MKIFSVLCLTAAAVVQAQSNCKAVTFTVTGTGQNRNITGSPPLDSAASLAAFYLNAAVVNVTGSQTLAATYCTPLSKNSNNAKLQVLLGSITEDRSGWSALGGTGTDYPQYKPELYSWVGFANAVGYPTLAVDRLGTGKSSHPDPILVVQAPYEEALYANLATQLRAGAPQIGTKYSFLIYVGNSYGSQLGVQVAGSYPTAYDEFILTGFTKNVDNGFAGVALTMAEPAAIVDPARFGNLPPGYLTTSSQVGRTNSFFGSKVQVSFEDTVANLFFQRKDVVSVGQFASVYANAFYGGGFTGRVFVLDGENDQPFCGLGSPVLAPAFCGTQPKDSGILFPNAQYNYHTVNRIGHAVQLHQRSLILFATAHAFLAGANFQGGTPFKA